MSKTKAWLRDKLISADEAAKLVKSGDLVRLPLGPVPLTLMNALMRRQHDLRDVQVIQGIPQYHYPFALEPQWQSCIRLITDFINAPIRQGYSSGLVQFQVTDAVIGYKVQEDGRRDNWASDVFMALVSEPDDEGFVSFGYSLWYARSVARAAKLRIAEIAPDVVRTGGDNRFPISEFDYVAKQVDIPRPLSFIPRLSEEEITVIEVIGAYVSTLIRDGDTVQLGTGTVSSSMGHHLMGKHDLGIDAEIIVPSAVELVRAGVATGNHKTTHQGKAVASFLVPGDYMDFVDGNPAFELYDVEYVNSVGRISANERQVAVNQALAIDLTGQVTAESVGGKLWSGPGGQLVWTMGALFSKGGRAIHVLPATAQGGTVSRIVPRLEPGTVVTVPRTFVDFVVTEYGVASLQGKTERERADELIAIAHPDFRAELRREAGRL
ncbi:MAG: acetyl-CoA hydrolase/transferase family protein [Anaerolineae bacterium]